ncbi:hypothetical protein HZS_6916 [Henneguya salminicola]|nr:hypothetical protein HZS_6916 [Henneguya salminicola]
MLRYIFGAITERHFIGYTENSYLDYLERQIVHILLVGNCSRKKIIAQLSIYREINSSEDKSSFQLLDSILPKVANINSSNQLDNTFSLKDIFYDHINRFYYQLNLTQVSSVYENLKRRSQHLPIKYRPLPLPSLKPEFIGIIDFLVSDAFINFLLNLINQIWSNTNTIYKESDLFELSLMCLNLIISTLFIPHIKSQYDNKLNSILMPQEIFNNKSILEFLTDIEKQIAEPITLAVIQAIILQLTSGRSDQRHISTNPEIDHKKKAVERKEAILEQIKEFSENFYKHNPDWLLYNENPPQTDQDVEKNTVLTNVLDKKIYCIVCKMSQNVEIAHSHSITEFPTNFVYCARLRWTRRLSGYTSFFANTPHIETDIPTALIQLSIEDIYSTDSSMPKLYLSGCSHLLHFSCATANENILSTVNGAVRTNHSYQCSICTTNNNVFLPNINPFYFMQPKNINISSFMEWASSTIFCAQKQSQSDTTSTIDEIQPITPMPSFGFNTDIYHMDEHSSLHFDRYNMAFFKYVKTADNSESFIGKYEPIIAITQNCLVCTISVLEIVSRNEENSSIFHHSISETTNFLTCAQFSRYCYYSSGLAPSLANREHYESHLFALIKAYASSCFIITTFLKILKNEISVNEFPEINNVDYFSLLISTLFGFSCMNRLLYKFSSPPTTYIHDLLTYLYLPHNFTSIFKKDELILFRTYFSKFTRPFNF